MAAVCVLSRPEKTCPLFDEASDKPLQGSPPPTFPPQRTNPRATRRVQTHAKVACTLPTEKTHHSDIEELCNATLIIDQAFYDIGRKLSDSVKHQGKRADLHEACRALETQWNEHHLTYKKLLWHSREFAGDAQVAVDDFRELVLPSLRAADRSPKEKMGIIRRQIEVLRGMSEPSRHISQEFIDFGRSLDTFIAKFSLVVESLEIAKQSKKVENLEKRLRSAKDVLATISQEVKELGRMFAADAVVTGIAILLAFVTPTWWAKLVDTAAIAISITKARHSGAPFFETADRCDAAVTEYEEILAEYEMQKASLSQMVKLECTLHSSRPLIQEVTMRLGIFANVWAAIRADMCQLRGKLQNAADTTSPLFIQRVEMLEELYGSLSQALRHYQVTVWAPNPSEFVPL